MFFLSGALVIDKYTLQKKKRIVGTEWYIGMVNTLYINNQNKYTNMENILLTFVFSLHQSFNNFARFKVI